MNLPEPPKPGIMTFLVERYWPGVTRPALDAAVDRVRQAVPDTRGEGGPVAHVATLLVDADEVVFCLFTAPSREDVVAVNERAEFRFDRIVEGTWLPWATSDDRPPRQSRARHKARATLSGLAIVSALLLGACSAGAPAPSSATTGSGAAGAASQGTATSAAPAAAGSQATVDQCSFLTTAEIESATGLTVVRSGPQPNYRSRCQWTLSGKGNEIATVAMHVELDSATAARDQEFNCKVGFGLAPISGVGDSACGQEIEGGSYSLYARRGDDLVSLDASPDASRSIDASAWASLAQAVFAKLP